MGGRATLIAGLALAALAGPAVSGPSALGPASALAPARADAAGQDVAATHAYVQANYALGRAAYARIGPVKARIQTFDGALAHECAGAGAGSPEDEASEPMAYEVAVALVSLAYGTDAGPIATFIKSTGHLRWSNPQITRRYQHYARSLHEYATLPLPHLCEEVSAWKATGFQQIPAATLRQVSHEQAIVSEAIPAGLLAPYERGSDASLLARTEALETKIEEEEFETGQTDWYELLETLGMPA